MYISRFIRSFCISNHSLFVRSTCKPIAPNKNTKTKRLFANSLNGKPANHKGFKVPRGNSCHGLLVAWSYIERVTIFQEVNLVSLQLIYPMYIEVWKSHTILYMKHWFVGFVLDRYFHNLGNYPYVLRIEYDVHNIETHWWQKRHY